MITALTLFVWYTLRIGFHKTLVSSDFKGLKKIPRDFFKKLIVRILSIVLTPFLDLG